MQVLARFGNVQAKLNISFSLLWQKSITFCIATKAALTTFFVVPAQRHSDPAQFFPLPYHFPISLRGGFNMITACSEVIPGSNVSINSCSHRFLLQKSCSYEFYSRRHDKRENLCLVVCRDGLCRSEGFQEKMKSYCSAAKIHYSWRASTSKEVKWFVFLKAFV